MFKNLTKLNNQINELGDFVGLTEAQILDIEEKFNVKLPNAYKEFLTYFGANQRGTIRSYHMTYPQLLDVRSDAVLDTFADDRMIESDKIKFSNSDYFFAQWQGAHYFFFDLSKTDIEDDPPVYAYVSCYRIDKSYDSFSEFLLKSILN